LKLSGIGTGSVNRRSIFYVCWLCFLLTKFESDQCGSVAGDAQFPASLTSETANAEYNGMAPKAKLAFIDIEDAAGNVGRDSE
jgi:hypothetical protein